MNSWAYSRAEHGINLILNSKPKFLRIEEIVTYLKLANEQCTHRSKTAKLFQALKTKLTLKSQHTESGYNLQAKPNRVDCFLKQK